MIRKLTGWALCGWAAGIAVGAFEAALLLVTASHMFFDSRELAITIAWTVGISTGTGVCAGLIFGTFASLFEQLRKRNSTLHKSLPATALLSLLILPLCWYSLHKLTDGPQASQMPGREAIVGIVAVIASTVFGWCCIWVSKTKASDKKRVRILGMAGILIATVAYFADLTVLVRLYPIFHFALTIVTLVLLTASLYFWFRPVPSGWRLAVSFLVLVLTATAFQMSLAKVRDTQNARFVIRERTVAVCDVLRLARHLDPPPPEKSLDEKVEQDETELLSTSGVPTILRPGASLILLTVDAMRYDRLKLLGSKRVVAKNLDSLAEQSVVFTRAYTPIPHTSYAISSLMTGKYTAPLFHIPGVPSAHETWPEILHRFRYETAGFYTRAVFFIDRNRFEPYIQSGLNFNHRHIDYKVPASERADQIISFLEEQKRKERPVFAWAHFFDPHEPYDSNCTHFGRDPVDRYDCEIMMVDKALGRVLTFLEEAYPEAIVVVASDHGEEFDDHGGRFHGTTLYDEQVRVPLLFKIPGVPHRLVNEPVNLVDVLGTCLEILDVPVPARVRSRSLSSLLAGGLEKRTAFCEIPGKKMVVSDEHKLICLEDLDLCELYDLESDPLEKRSISSQKPELVSRLKSLLRTWNRSHARLELRPLDTNQGQSGKWPPALRLAIAGDKSAVPELLKSIESDQRIEVRRKAGELLFDLWGEKDAPGVGLNSEDPEVLSWIAALRLKRGQRDGLEILTELAPGLTPSTKIWRTAALMRLESGDQSALKQVLEIAVSSEAPHRDRIKAIRLLGHSGRRDVAVKLLPLVNDYQLTLETAKALGKLKAKRAVDTLVTRLKRERFLERKSAIILALVKIDEIRASPAITQALQSMAFSQNESKEIQGICDNKPVAFLSAEDSSETLWMKLSGTTATCDTLMFIF